MKKTFLSEEQNDVVALVLFIVSMILLLGSFYYYAISHKSWFVLGFGTILFLITFRSVYRSFAYFFTTIEDGDND